MNRPIQLYNTKTRALETFLPIEEKKVSIYSCGPTVYHYQHLGNMRAAVFADTLHRMFLANDYTVKHVINITDVGHLVGDGDEGEDKMEKGAKREGKTVWEISAMYTDLYFKDLESLAINTTEYQFPKATDNIQEQIALVQNLESKGYTYRIQDGIYFDTAKFPRYADFAKLNIEGLESGARVEENKEKKNITDFALWKFSPTDEKRQMEWDSPWGVGFPGWHIECSAMSMKYLGNHFDIHTGGIEHITVHHTNEIAQSECATGETYATYWMHNNHLQDTTGKMSKSSGDFLTITSLVEKGYSPIVYRYFLMTAHYRKELSFSFEALDAATVAYKKLQHFVQENKNEHDKLDENYKERFLTALSDDLSTPTCIAELWNLTKDDSLSTGTKVTTMLYMSTILGLDLEKEETALEVPEEVQVLLEKRAQARASKDFILSDTLRDAISALGFTVKDTPQGQELRK